MAEILKKYEVHLVSIKDVGTKPWRIDETSQILASEFSGWGSSYQHIPLECLKHSQRRWTESTAAATGSHTDPLSTSLGIEFSIFGRRLRFNGTFWVASQICQVSGEFKSLDKKLASRFLVGGVQVLCQKNVPRVVASVFVDTVLKCWPSVGQILISFPRSMWRSLDFMSAAAPVKHAVMQLQNVTSCARLLQMKTVKLWNLSWGSKRHNPALCYMWCLP